MTDQPPDGGRSPVTSVVLPTYNEEGNVEQVVEELRETLAGEYASEFAPFEILIIDDGSTDGTTRIVKELAETHPEIETVVLRRNFGKSAALAAGFERARGQFIVTMDADGQDVPQEIPRLLRTVEEGYDCVSGWRRDRQDPLSKRAPSKVQTWLARLTGPDIHDFVCGLKAYRAGAVKDLTLIGENHRYIPAMLYKRGYRVTEREVEHRVRRSGSTHYSIARLWRGVFDLFFHVFWNRYSVRPLHVFGGFGALLSSIGFAIGIHAVIIKYAYGVQLSPRLPRLVLTIGLILFGLQVFLFGFLAEMIARVYYQSESPYRVESIYPGPNRK